MRVEDLKDLSEARGPSGLVRVPSECGMSRMSSDVVNIKYLTRPEINICSDLLGECTGGVEYWPCRLGNRLVNRAGYRGRCLRTENKDSQVVVVSLYHII